jgi:glycosyltransferase involved in cell wall biosynthesis
MRILFVSYSQPDNNSGIQIFNLANHLTRLGVECVVCVPRGREAVTAVGSPNFETFNFAELRRGSLAAKVDLLHVWTPREGARRNAEELLGMHACPYIVHLEENEEVVTAGRLGIPASILRRLPDIILGRLIRSNMSHPRRYPEFLARARGITMVVDRLGELSPTGIPRHKLEASYEEEMAWDRPPDAAFRRSLGLGELERVVVYTGNAHALNWRQVADLYEAIEILRGRGLPVRLVRTGTNHLRLRPRQAMAIRRTFAVELGRLARADLPRALSIADVLVEPGAPGAFNDYRFPSKLPEYLASGKPVILPRTNVGLSMENGVECLLLERGDPQDIAQKLELLLSSQPLREKIGAGGRKYAEQHLKAGQIAKGLQSFYSSI